MGGLCLPASDLLLSLSQDCKEAGWWNGHVAETAGHDTLLPRGAQSGQSETRMRPSVAKLVASVGHTDDYFTLNFSADSKRFNCVIKKFFQNFIISRMFVIYSTNFFSCVI